MKRWEEERKRRQYADKIHKAKSTLKTQPKGAKITRTSTLNASGQYGSVGKYGSEDEQLGPGGVGAYPARGRAEFPDADQQYAMQQQVGFTDHQASYQPHSVMTEQQADERFRAMEGSAGRRTGQHEAGSADRRGMMNVMSSAAHPGVLGMAGPQDFAEQSPAMNLQYHAQYRHAPGTSSSQYNNQMRKSQREAAREVPDYQQHRRQRESGGTLSGYGGASGPGASGSQYGKPRQRYGQGNASSNTQGPRKAKPFSTDLGSATSKKTMANKRGAYGRNTPQLTELPLYQLLKAFKLQQYTLKMHDLGYGVDVYKLALLTPAQRDNFVEQLKVMPGHRAKIAGFFSVIDEIYPRQKVLEQISAVTPQRAATKGSKKSRVGSAGRTRGHLGPQKTLLQQYEKLDKTTKQAFTRHFLQSLEGAQQSIGELISQHVDVAESTNAINQIFPPEQYFGNAQKVLRQAQARKRDGQSQEMEDLVNQFVMVSRSTGSQQSQKQGQKSRAKQGGHHASEQQQQQMPSTSKQQSRKSGDRVPGYRSQSKERRLKDIDKISQEVERKLKLQRKQEKERIKQYGQVYGGALFGAGSSAATLPSTASRAASGSVNLQRRQSGSRDKRIKSSTQSSRASRERKTGASPQKPKKDSRQGSAVRSRSKGRPRPTSQGRAPLAPQPNIQRQMRASKDQDLPRYENSDKAARELEQCSLIIQTDSERRDLDRPMGQQQYQGMPANTRYELPEDSYDQQELKDMNLNQMEPPVKILEERVNYQEAVQCGKEERGLLEPEVNLFAASRIFEDTTGGTSGIDVEALVSDLAREKQIPQDQVPTGHGDSSGGAVDASEQLLGNLQVPQTSLHGGGAQEVQVERYPVQQEVLYDDPEVRQADIARESSEHGRDTSGISSDHRSAVRASRDVDSLDMSLDVQERPDQQSLAASPDELDPDQQDSEPAGWRQSSPRNENQQSEAVSVATPNVDIQHAPKDHGAVDRLLTGDSNQQLSSAAANGQLLEGQDTSGLEQARPMSPLLAPREREAAFNLGQSLDSKKVTSALGYLDLKQICYCLAQALSKHIEFSRGQFFLGDLKRLQMQTADVSPEMVEFSYNLGAELKIDIDAAKQKQLEKKQKQEQSKKDFEQLMKKMESAQSMPKKTPKQLTNTKYQSEGSSDGSKNAPERQTDPRGCNDDDASSPADEIIADETPSRDGRDGEEEDGRDQKYIEDFYDEDTEHNDQNEQHPENLDQLDMDMDYSKTQLDDFLKSQSNRGLSSQQLLQSFVSTYNKTRCGTQREGAASQSRAGNAASVGRSASSAIAGGHGKNIKSISSAARGISPADVDNDMQPIDEGENEESHGTVGENKHDQRRQGGGDFQPGDADDGDEYDTTRTPEVVNLDEVRANDDEVRDPKERLQLEQVKREKDQKAFDQFDVSSAKGFKELLRFQMRIFDQNYDFEQDELVGGEAEYTGDPSLEELYYYCKYVIVAGRMEKEIPILCLVYIERFLTKTGLLINFANWKRLTLISLILASKIWDDDSLENVHFPQVMGDITLKEIAGLEKVFLQLIDFDLVIRGSEYAKYYFILKGFADSFNSVLPMGPLSVGQMSHLQNNTLKAESELRERYHIKVSLKNTM